LALFIVVFEPKRAIHDGDGDAVSSFLSLVFVLLLAMVNHATAKK
jgi:hypothetical protein